MPEVISLLSSPDFAPARSRATVASNPPRAGPSKLSDSQSFSFDDNDIATYDLVDGILPPELPPRLPTARSSKPATSQAVSLLSEDEFTSPQVSRKTGASAPTDAPAPKRVRLSPEVETSPTFQTWSFSRLNSTEQLKDSAEASRPSSKPKATYIDIDDDPFASSPPREREKARVELRKAQAKRAPADDDDDPFASPSPQKENRSGPSPSGTKNLSVDYVSLFESPVRDMEKKREPLKTKYSFDDDVELFSSSARDAPARPEPAKKAVAWDPISSSAPLPGNEKLGHGGLRRVKSGVLSLDSDDSISGSDSDFPDVLDIDMAKIKAWKRASEPPPKSSSKPRTTSTKAAPKPRAPAAKKSAVEKELDREERAAVQKAERERKEREKKRQQEQRALEKQKARALAEVNKVRTDKKVSTPEMIVDLPNSFEIATKCQAEALLDRLEVESATWHSPLDNIIRWRRKVKSIWNPDLERWDPIPPRIDHESYAMVMITAPEFVEHVLNGTLDTHAAEFKAHFPAHTLIYLLEGLTPWLRKNRSLRNRHFTELVRAEAHNDENPAAPTQRRRKAPAQQQQEYVDEDTIEDALLNLHVIHSALIHHTNAPVETAQWIATFTQHISTVPYRRQREESNAAAAGFCMETGQVRTGDGAKDTYLRMLQEIGRITAPIAYGIAGEFDTVAKLVRGLERGGPMTLEAVRKSANKNGEFSDRAVGPSVSKRVYKIFTGTDEMSEDI
ncbi:hypothetical protein OQA88_12373 [Cercophora sp. LCS_1]